MWAFTKLFTFVQKQFQILNQNVYFSLVNNHTAHS